MIFPLEIYQQIGLHLTEWNDIWSFTMAILDLRKVLKFAKYARAQFEKIRKCERAKQRFCIYFGDDRCRHAESGKWGMPDDFEHWIVDHPWIDYSADFEKGPTLSPKMWCYLPYGDNFNNKTYGYKRMIGYCGCDECCEGYILDRVLKGSIYNEGDLKTGKEKAEKEKYDNAFKKTLITKYNNITENNSCPHERYVSNKHYIGRIWTGYGQDEDPEMWPLESFEYCTYNYQI